MKILYLDARTSGLAGDMCVAALVDAGAPVEALDAAFAELWLEAHSREITDVRRGGIAARGFRVHADAPPPQRTWKDIRALLGGATLPPPVRDRALAIFEHLARAEGEVHGVPLDDVHFHEVGALDSIVDVVAVSAALEALAPDRIVASPLPLGHGTVQTQHGTLPLPAPATLACLKGVPTFDGGVAAELVTPTGAAIVATQAVEFGGWPAMRAQAIGYGAGTRELPDRANVLRAVVGEGEDAPLGLQRRPLLVLETSIDDASPELLAHALDRLLQVGARDAWIAPVTMKKGRAGSALGALCESGARDAVIRVMLSETGSLGVRVSEVERFARPRTIVRVETRFGPIDVKVAEGDALPRHVAPEFDACRAAAREHEVSVKEVMAAAIAAFEVG